jgi:hypothetical protein
MPEKFIAVKNAGLFYCKIHHFCISFTIKKDFSVNFDVIIVGLFKAPAFGFCGCAKFVPTVPTVPAAQGTSPALPY